MTTIDLDALRAARSETEHEQHVLTFKDKKFTLPPVLDVDFLLAVSRTTPEGKSNPDWNGIINALFNGEREEFLQLKPDVQDLNDIIGEVTKLYAGATSGE